MYGFGVIDGIISEADLMAAVDTKIKSALKELDKLSGQELADARYDKFRYFDEALLATENQKEMEVV